MRKDIPDPEEKLWHHLRARRLESIKFRRQYSVGPYVTDFYCPDFRLAIELDGDSHYESQDAQDYDRQRQEYIETCGIKVLRFKNTEIKENLGGVLETIAKVVKHSNSI